MTLLGKKFSIVPPKASFPTRASNFARVGGAVGCIEVRKLYTVFDQAHIIVASVRQWDARRAALSVGMLSEMACFREK